MRMPRPRITARPALALAAALTCATAVSVSSVMPAGAFTGEAAAYASPRVSPVSATVIAAMRTGAAATQVVPVPPSAARALNSPAHHVIGAAAAVRAAFTWLERPGTTILGESLAYVSVPRFGAHRLAWLVSLDPAGGWYGVRYAHPANYLVAVINAATGRWMMTEAGHSPKLPAFRAVSYPRRAIAAGSPKRSGGGDGCNPQRGNNYLHYNFAGARSGNVNGTPGGVYATIGNYSPFVAGPNQGAPSSDDVSEWVMLDGSNGYAQVGWIEFPGSARDTFQEWSNSSGFHDNYFSPFPINSQQTYAVYYRPGNQFPFTFAVNGVTYDNIAGPGAPSDAQINAEIHTNASQIPGGWANTNPVSNAHVWPKAGSGSSWQNFEGETPVPGESWIGLSPADSTGVNAWWTWDNACQD